MGRELGNCRRFYLVPTLKDIKKQLELSKFDRETFYGIQVLAGRDYKQTFDELWKKIVFFRYFINSVEVIAIVNTGIVVYFLSKHNFSMYFSFFIFGVMIHAIKMGAGNYIQDRSFDYISVLQNGLTRYLTRRNVDGDYLINVQNVHKYFISILSLERFPNIYFTLLLISIIYSYLLRSLFNVSPLLSVVTLLGIILVSFFYTYFMNKTYSITADINKRRTTLISNANQLQDISFDKISKHSLKNPQIGKMTTIKVIANVYANAFFVFLIVMIILTTRTYPEFVTVLGISLLLHALDSRVLFLWRQLPEATYALEEVIKPLIKLQAEKIPTPLSTHGTDVIDYKQVINLRLEDVKVEDPNTKKLILEAKNLAVPIKKGLYLITGDSGEGKSTLMSVVGRTDFVSSGKIFFDVNGKESNFDDLDFETFRKWVDYVWVTEKRFDRTSPLKLLRLLVPEQAHNQNFDELFRFDIDLSKVQQDYFLNSVRSAENPAEQAVEDILQARFLTWFEETGLFRSNENHILDLDFSKLSGGQTARFLTALFLLKNSRILLIDEGLERTTKGYEDGVIYTRDRLINFISHCVGRLDKCLFLMIQGGADEVAQIKNSLGEYYLGNIIVKDGIPTLL